jgi:predicted transcriptional regulator
LKISTLEIINIISDDKALALFKIIASTNNNNNNNSDGDTLRTKTKFSRTQYYSRLSSFIKMGLIKRRKGGNYSLTSFGKVIYEIQRIFEYTVNNYYWKLKAVDSAQLPKEISREEYTKLVDSLIDNQKIKEIIAAGSF